MADFDLPFEETPGDLTVDLEGELVGGLHVSGGHVETGAGDFPVLVFRFIAQDDSMKPAIVLVLDDEHMLSIGRTLAQAAAAAVQGARDARG